MGGAVRRRLVTTRLPGRDGLLCSPFCFRVSLPGSEDPLTGSVARLGLITPPTMLEGGADRTEILLGHRRLAAAASAGLGEVEALVLDIGREDAVSLWLEDARSGEPLSDLEKIILLDRTGRLSGGDLEPYLSRLSPVFGRSVTARLASRLISILGLGGEVLSALHEGRLSLSDLLSLGEHPGIDARSAALLIAGARMSRGSRKEAVRLMSLLADQGRERWEGFLEERSAGADEDLPAALRRACFPKLEGDLRYIRSTIESIGLPRAAAIHPPRDLEGGAYHFTLRLRKEEETAIAIEKMGRALESGKIGKLLERLRGLE